ncbi:MAG: fatty acid hydroxylase, partial [Quisquiliibacterium sp.]
MTPGGVFSWLDGWIAFAQGWLFEQVIQPAMYSAGLMHFADQAFDATEWLVIGLIEIVLLMLLMGWAQRRWPVEALLDRAAVRIDIIYTLLHRLGAFPLLAFALLTPVVDLLEGDLRMLGFSRLNVDQLWPGVTDLPLVSFLIYL